MITVTLVVFCGLAALAFLRRQSAALRHWVLFTALAGAAAAPAVDWMIPAWDIAPVVTIAKIAPAYVTTPPAHLPGSPIEDTARNPEPLRALPSAATLLAIWTIGTVVSLLLLSIGLLRLNGLARRSTAVRDGIWAEQAEALRREFAMRRRISILQSDHPGLLVTWGLLRPKLILPAGAGAWPEARVRVVLSHELAHVRRGDWAAQMLAELLRAFYWFNPIVWLASRRLRHESERACDDAVLRSGVEGSTYASHLLELARAIGGQRKQFPESPAPAMVRRSSFERRVRAMLKKDLNRRTTTRGGRLACAAGAAGLTVLIAALGAAAQSLATFSGSILDPMNAAVPKVTVTLTNTATRATHKVSSDDRGSFEFSGLPPGEYLFEAQFPGFTTLEGHVSVAGLDVQRTLTLQVGSLSETIHVQARQVPSTPSPAESSTAAPQKVDLRSPPCRASAAGGNIRPPIKLRDVKPVYPAHLAAQGLAGAVELKGRVGTDGFVRDIAIVEAAHPEFAKSAADAVRQWQFDATLLNCVPIEVVIGISVRFDIEKE